MECQSLVSCWCFAFQRIIYYKISYFNFVELLEIFLPSQTIWKTGAISPFHQIHFTSNQAFSFHCKYHPSFDLTEIQTSASKSYSNITFVKHTSLLSQATKPQRGWQAAEYPISIAPHFRKLTSSKNQAKNQYLGTEIGYKYQMTLMFEPINLLYVLSLKAFQDSEDREIQPSLHLAYQDM